MNEQICQRCKRPRPASAFTKTQKWCRKCRAEYGKTHYINNREKYRESKRRSRARMLTFIDAEKAKPCADCTHTFPPECMDFDHVRGKKVAGVNVLMKIASMKRIKAEIAKCEVVCSNCHRIRTKRQAIEQQNAPTEN